MNEFSLIKKYFAPLAAGFAGGLGLTDDAAVFSPPSGHELVITKDAICEGVHFIGNEPPEMIAAKALRVNLSDLAAMGATPICYFLALSMPKDTSEEWVAKFAVGLQKTQSEFAISLAGGDTTATLGALTISITAIGSLPTGSALRRNGAQVGDDIFVSGTLGDAALGLKILAADNRQLTTNNHLINRYLTPIPRLALGQSLRGIASSCMDISDGLLQDLGHICAASHVGAVIYSEKLPISEAARNTGGALESAISGGDDYELLFSVPPEKAHLVPKGCTKIGEIIAGETVKLLNENGEDITPINKGFSHF